MKLIFGEPGKSPQSAQAGVMSEGDYHSGPHGYSPNTAYPDTEYGDSSWEAEEH
ncbi:MAG: hypothetical protein ACKOWR_05825 [Micrococcales bacterium]